MRTYRITFRDYTDSVVSADDILAAIDWAMLSLARYRQDIVKVEEILQDEFSIYGSDDI